MRIEKKPHLNWRLQSDLLHRVHAYADYHNISVNHAITQLVEKALLAGELVNVVRKELAISREMLAAERYIFNLQSGRPASSASRLADAEILGGLPCPEATGFGPKAGVWPFDRASSQNGNEPWPA